ncbi:MAG TPA: superoxide dismutase [Bacteroidetes bacterium]|nr:superoxide dismutase [Bacteroidota bacterium]
MAFELPKLPYPIDALEPYISRKTLEFHYGKHHRAYVNNVNSLSKGTKFENADLETIIREADGGLYNNGAQAWNHTFYFMAFGPDGPKEPVGMLADAINRDFGSFENFKEEFSKKAAILFGSGWTWLVKDDAGKLQIIMESNAGNPLRNGFTPIMTCDVWEHAYYLDYQNRRTDYISSFWSLLNWDVISGRNSL